MRDPRNWVRPAAALVVGGRRGVALVLLRARRAPARLPRDCGGWATPLAERSRDVGREPRKLLGDR